MLAFIVLGFGVKIGLVPLHVWMPLTYTAAPIATAAVLSGAAVKAGVIGMIRFLPFDAPLPSWGYIIAAIGFFSAFYGVAIGLTQRNPKTVLAYSSISQMGVIATVIGMGLATGMFAAPLLAAFYALHHMLVKGGLFLAIGLSERSGPRSFWLLMLPAALIALGLGGLPLTGGALAKLAAKPVLDSNITSVLSALSAVCSTLLMMHFLRRLSLGAQGGDGTGYRTRLAVPWLSIASAAIILPWVLYPVISGNPWSEALGTKALWDSLWPVLIGAGLALALFRGGLRLPTIPPGDILIICEPVVFFGQRLGAEMERIDGALQRWPVAGVTVLLLVALLAGAMLTGG
jgi:formate hydrogenlyase subunit 3/multisubunit Na+/H+ antiporter MnhD subunit